MERALAFYRDTVGLSVLSESAAFSFLDGGTIRVALNATGDARMDETGTEIVLEVDDVTGSYEAMLEAGVPFAVEPRPVMSTNDGELHAAHFRDPDGHVWSITGWVAPG